MERKTDNVGELVKDSIRESALGYIYNSVTYGVRVHIGISLNWLVHNKVWDKVGSKVLYA